jgi:radical SAM superfamily enzyme YgiQ (UPF0313 family)
VLEQDLTAVDTIGLVACSPGEHPELADIIKTVKGLGKRITLSSVRADTLSGQLINALVSSGTHSLTLAPETGSERMKRVINKRLDETQMTKNIAMAARLGIRSLTLYFLVGLPWEMETDVAEAAALAGRLAEAFLAQSSRGRVVVEVNPFVPKPRTAFQWCRMENSDRLKQRLDSFARVLGKRRGVRLSRGSIRQAILQAILSRGDEHVGRALYRHVTEGVPLIRAVRAESPRTMELVFSDLPLDKALPWSWLISRSEERYLRTQYREAERLAFR